MTINKNTIKGVVLAGVLVLLVGFAYCASPLNKNKGYSVVYLSTGEIYVGKLSTFPGMQLDSGYILGTAKDATDPSKSTFQLNPLAEALWAPKHLHLNREQVVFTGLIEVGSKIGDALKNK